MFFGASDQISEENMNKILRLLPIAVVTAGLVCAAGTAQAQVGTNTGESMNERMVVNVDNGNVREKPNPTAKILTKVPRGFPVTVIGTTNGGAWAHVKLDTGLDGYIDLTQLSKPAP